MLNLINKCEVCGNQDLEKILDLGLHPMCDDLVEFGSQRTCKEYPIEILFCKNCLTAHQKFQIPQKELFPKTYHYRSRHTGDVLNGMMALVESFEKNYGSLNQKKVLDIGCNDGSLLSFFKDKGASTFGIEPTSAYEDAIKNGHEIINDFFNEKISTDFVAKYGKVDVITFTNVFAHIEDLQALIKALKILLHDETIIIIENHYLGAVIDKFQFDTFYHEHPRTYSCNSFAHIGKSLGMQIDYAEFPSRYNGNIRVIYSSKFNKNNSNLKEILASEKNFYQDFTKLVSKIDPWRMAKRNEIENLVKIHGKLRAKAFPGRAAIIVKMLNLDENLIEAVYEKPLSGKINHYVPATRIPILSDNEFNFSDNKPLLNFAWHISNEIKIYMENKGYLGKIIDII